MFGKEATIGLTVVAYECEIACGKSTGRYLLNKSILGQSPRLSGGSGRGHHEHRHC